jgi:hypothetical protein
MEVMLRGNRNRFKCLKSLIGLLKDDEVKNLDNMACAYKRTSKRKFRSSSSHPEVSESEGHKIKPWWTKWRKSDIVALDSEMVSVLKTLGKGYVNKTATVSISDFWGRIILDNLKVYHEPGSFLENNPVTRFRKYDFVKGEELSSVRDKVLEIIKGKPVLGVNIRNDFEKLGLAISEFDVFDLHSHWFRSTETNPREKIGLRSLYKYYFDQDVQFDAHNASTDAIATMKLFADVYIKIKTENVESMFNDKEFTDIPTYKG